MCGLGVWVFFFLPFQLLVLYVSVAVTGIYNMSIAYTPYTYVVLKTEAVYLVKIPKLWKIIRGNHNVWLSTVCFSFCFFCRFSWSLAVVVESSAHIIRRLTGWGFVISLLPTPSGKLTKVALCGSSVAQQFALINCAIISLLYLC